MITNIHIKSFKSLVDISIPLGNLTILSGLNNSGKSSVIQAIRMFSEKHEGMSPLLTGHGDVTNLRSDFVSASEKIEFSFQDENKNISSMILSDHICSEPQFCPELVYVGADRLGPQAFLPLDTSLQSYPKIGDRGQFTFDFISKLNELGYLLPDVLVHKNSEGKTFEYVLQGWLTEISPGVKIKLTTNRKADVSHAEIDNYRPSNVGFGLSYTLPIIAATLGVSAYLPERKGQEEWVIDWEIKKEKFGVLLVLENPEAHLHPQGQTAMGKMIALAASNGIQIIVETHSEHVMDGIRIAVKEKDLSHELVKFHYFNKNEYGHTEITSPSLDENGKLSFWPNGFFDQALKNRSLLARKTK